MMRHSRCTTARNVRRRASVLGVALGLLLAACGSGSGATRVMPIPTGTAAPVATVPPLPAITPEAGVLSACAGPAGSALSIARMQVGPIRRVAVSERFNLGAAREWSGLACTASDMRALLPPPPTPPTPLLCPGALQPLV